MIDQSKTYSANIVPNMKDCPALNEKFKKIEEDKICLQKDGNLVLFENTKDKTNCIRRITGLIPCKKDGEVFYRRIEE